MNEVGASIRNHRIAAGMSQTQLAGDDLSPSYISLIESGRRQPSAEVLRVIAGRLHCSVTDLEGRPAGVRARHLELEVSYARLALAHGEAEDARARLLPILAEDGLDERSEDEIRLLLAEAHDKCDDLTAAAKVLLPVYDRAVERASHLSVARVSHVLCTYYLRTGDLNAAVRVAERGLDAVREQDLLGTEEHLKLAATLMWVFYELGDVVHALAYSEQLLTLAEAHGASAGQAGVYWNAALAAEAQGRVDDALALCERALARLGEQGSDRNLPRLRVQSAYLLMRAAPERAAEAAEALDQALPMLSDLGGPGDLAVWASRRSLSELLLGRPEGAEHLARQALLHLTTHPDTETAQALITLGDSLAAQGRTEEAQMRYLAAGETLGSLPGTRHVAALWTEIAERRLLSGRRDDALEAYRRALTASGIRSNTSAAEVAFGLRAPAPAREDVRQRLPRPAAG